MTTDITPLQASSDASTGVPLCIVAKELRVLARRIPHWNPTCLESWESYQVRRLAAERTLARRLGRLPGCTIASSENGWAVELTLAGITVSSRERLQGACVAWAARIGAPPPSDADAMEPNRPSSASRR